MSTATVVPSSARPVEAGPGANAERRGREEQLAPPNQDAAVKNGVTQYALRSLAEDERARRDAEQQLRESLEQDAQIQAPHEAPRGARRRRARPEHEQQQEQALPVTEYFSEVPAGMSDAVEAFRYEAKGKPITELRTSFLTAQFLLQFQRAQERGVTSFQFLNGLRNELRSRGVNMSVLVNYAAEQKNSLARAYFSDARNLTEEQLDLYEAGVLPVAGGAINAETERESVETADFGRTGFDATTYTVAPVRRIADEIARAAAIDRADMDYLDNSIQEIRALRTGYETNRTGGPYTAEIAECTRLLADIYSLKNEVGSREYQTRRRREEEEGRRREERESKGWYGERKMTDSEKKYLVESIIDPRMTVPANADEGRPHDMRGEDFADYMFSRMFTRADRRSFQQFRQAFGQAGQKELDDFFQVLNEQAGGVEDYIKRPLNDEERARLNHALARFNDEADMRERMHDINYVVGLGLGTEEVSKNVNLFEVRLADMAYGKKFVPQASHFFEQAMRQVMVENGGYLPYDAMVSASKGATDQIGSPGRVEQLTKTMLQNWAIATGVSFESWEIDRAFSIARGMGIVTARTLEIAASSRIPEEGQLVSMYAQDLLKDIAPFRHLYVKWNMGKQRGKILAYRLPGQPRGNFLKQTADSMARGLGNLATLPLGGMPTPWNPQELAELETLAAGEIFEKMTTDRDDDRYLDVLNPLGIGGMFTQTGWRYNLKDQEGMTTATGALRKGNPYNMILGVGIWIELQKGSINSHAHLDHSETIFGKRVTTEGQKAEVIIRESLRVAQEVSPLKLYNNLQDLQRAVDGRGDVRAMGNDGLKKAREDLALVQEALQAERVRIAKRNMEHVERGEALEDLPENLDFSVLDRVAGANRANAQTLAHVIKEQFHKNMPGRRMSHLDRFVDNLKNRPWKKAFVFGTDDLPYELYNFTATGGTSVSRRWRDIKDTADGAAALTDIMRHMDVFKDQGKLIEALRKVYDAISGNDEDVARDVIMGLAEGMTKFYLKSTVARLPYGIGTLQGINPLSRVSFAQIAFGKDAMAWDELDAYDFIHHLHAAGMLPEGHEGHARVQALRKRIAGGRIDIARSVLRTVTPLLFLVLAFYLLTKAKEDEER